MLPLLFLSAKQLKSLPQPLTGCILKTFEYSFSFATEISFMVQIIAQVQDPSSDTLDEVLSRLFEDYLTSLPDNTPSKVFACYPAKGSPSVLQPWPRCGHHISHLTVHAGI